MACSKLEARGHLLHKTGTPPKHFSRECIHTISLIFFSCLFVTYKGEWKFAYFDTSNPTAFNNDMLLFSTALSALAILSGTVKGIRSIKSIWKRLNKKKNQQNIPLEEEVSAKEENFSIIAKKPESYELPPKNLDETRKQLVSFADLCKSGDIKRVMTILPDGKILEIAPGENSRIRISSNEEVSQQNGTDTIE